MKNKYFSVGSWGFLSTGEVLFLDVGAVYMDVFQVQKQQDEHWRGTLLSTYFIPQ